MTCQATKRDGTRCQGPPRPDGYCWAHSPELRQKATEARRAGGKGKSTAVRAQKRMRPELKDIMGLLEGSMTGVYRGTLTPQQGSALASLAGAWVRLHELGEVEARLGELEAKVEARPGAAGWRS